MPNKYPSPKVEFLENKRFVSAHNSLVESPELRRQLRIAKDEYCRRLCSKPLDGGEPMSVASAMRFQKIQGVEEYLEIFFNLADQPTLPPKVGDQDNLPTIPGKPRRP
jgi:hypothetical protein